MSTAGKSGDALTRAGHVRAHTETQAKGGSDYPGFQGDATLAMPRKRTTTQQEREWESYLLAKEGGGAARCTARYLMLRSHGCTGEGCQEPGHEDDRRDLAEVLEMLGLVRAAAADAARVVLKPEIHMPGGLP